MRSSVLTVVCAVRIVINLVVTVSAGIWITHALATLTGSLSLTTLSKGSISTSSKTLLQRWALSKRWKNQSCQTRDQSCWRATQRFRWVLLTWVGWDPACVYMVPGWRLWSHKCWWKMSWAGCSFNKPTARGTNYKSTKFYADHQSTTTIDLCKDTWTSEVW